MPFFIFILFYTLGALLCTFIAISLNKIHKWITLKDFNNTCISEILPSIFLLAIFFWPISIITIAMMKCTSLFIEFCKNYIPKE